MFEGPDHDRLAIRELIDLYSDAVIRRDADRWASAWHGDAVWRIHDREVRGRDAIVSAWTSAMESYQAVLFIAFPGDIVVDGDTAAVRTHTFEHLVPRSGQARLQGGQYQDRLARTADGWKFIERTFSSRELAL